MAIGAYASAQAITRGLAKELGAMSFALPIRPLTKRVGCLNPRPRAHPFGLTAERVGLAINEEPFVFGSRTVGSAQTGCVFSKRGRE